MHALVIVHLSSIDSYAWNVGDYEADDLADNLVFALEQTKDPIFVLDQRWPDPGPFRQRVYDQLGSMANAETIYNNSDEAGTWERDMDGFAALLRSRGITELTLGGCWYRKDETSGCVTETKKLLTERGFECTVDEDIVGFEEETDS